MTNPCKGCGTAGPEGYPQSSACQNCPERDCPDCGTRIVGACERVDGGGSCPCWTSVADVPFADLKASLAADGLGLETDGRLTA